MTRQPRIFFGRLGPQDQPVRSLVVIPSSFIPWVEDIQQHFAQPDGAWPKVIAVPGRTFAKLGLDDLPPDFLLDIYATSQQPELLDRLIVAMPRWVAAAQVAYLMWLFLRHPSLFRDLEDARELGERQATEAREGRPPVRHAVFIRRTWRGGISIDPLPDKPEGTKP